MTLSATECLAKADELDRKAETDPKGGVHYRNLASQWRELAREAVYFERPNFGFNSKDIDPRH